MKNVGKIFLVLSIQLSSFGTHGNQGRLLEDDLEALQARVTLIEHAEKEIQFEYFEVAHDPMALTGMALMLEAAQRGVKVKVLADFLNNELRQAQMAAITESLDGTPWAGNFQIKVFNPPGGINLLHRTYRNHDKMLNVDGSTARPMMIIGGRNAAETYFGLSTKFNYLDVDALIVGPAAKITHDYFDTLWNKNPEVKNADLGEYAKDFWANPCPVDDTRCERRQKDVKKEIAKASYEISAYLNQFKQGKMPTKSEPLETQLNNMTELGPIDFLFNDPLQMMTKVTNRLADQVIQLLKDKFTKDVIIVTPYLFPTEAQIATFRELTSRGTRIRIYTNSLASTDSTLVHAAFLRIKQKLIDSGIEVYMFKPHQDGVNPAGKTPPLTLHCKGIIINEQLTVLGSFNFDIRSANLNREIGFIMGERNGPLSTLTQDLSKFIHEKIMSRSVKIFGDKKEDPKALEELDQLATEAQKLKLEQDAKSVDAYWNHI